MFISFNGHGWPYVLQAMVKCKAFAALHHELDSAQMPHAPEPAKPEFILHKLRRSPIDAAQPP